LDEIRNILRRKKMSQEIDLSQDSDDNGEWPNTAFVPSPPPSRKNPLEKEVSFNDEHPRKKNGPGNKTATATGLAEFAGELENDSDDSSEKALPYQGGEWAEKFKELYGYRQCREHCSFRDEDPKSMLSFRSGCFHNAASTGVWSEVNVPF
jgi:hypothetical protein